MVVVRQLKACGSMGEGPDTKPCVHFVTGRCRSNEYCPFQCDKDPEAQAKEAEKVQIPDRIIDLLSRIAVGNLKLDDFIDGDTNRSITTAMEVISTYDPNCETYDPRKLDDPQAMEKDGLHLAAINARLGNILGSLVSDYEAIESYVKELEARKMLELEKSFRIGLRTGSKSDSRIKALVLADDQAVSVKESMFQIARRRSIMWNLTSRIESMVNMIKKRCDGLRKER